MNSSSNMHKELRTNTDSLPKSNESSGNGNTNRRSSDVGPPPLNRNRSFKTKQLVRSKAIRESQSPPRIPSPRPGVSGDARIVKVKSASVDLDDRTSFDTRSSDESVQQNDVVVVVDENSFKSNNISCKSILVSTNGDKKTLGANVLNHSTVSLENKSNKNDDDCDNVHRNNDHTKHNSQIITDNLLNEKYNKSSEEYNIEKVNILDCTNNNDNKCLSLDCKTPLKSYSALSPQSLSDGKCSPNADSSPTAKNHKILLKNLKNFNDTGKDKKCDTSNIDDDVKPIEIQVNTDDYAEVLYYHDDNNKSTIMHDCGIGPSIELDEDEEELAEETRYDNLGRRAICPSKQDSGVCCWDSCNYCGDISPDINVSDNEDDGNKLKHNEAQLGGCESARIIDRAERWGRMKNGNTLTVQRSSSGGSRLLRKQSSGGSMDSGQHSIASPFLSRDSSTEQSLGLGDTTDVVKFIKETLNKSSKDRLNLLKIEHELISFVKDPFRKEFKFPAASSYGRLLVHRCAELFGLRHMLDPQARHIVIVAKLPNIGVSYRIPPVCPFQQWCTVRFPSSPTIFCEPSAQAKSILKRDTQSLDEEPAVTITPQPPKLLQTPKSKSFEQREEEYVKARRRIFSSSGNGKGEGSWVWSKNGEDGNENEISPPLIITPDTQKAGRLLKVQSMEHEVVNTSVRGVVLKAHSFGGYGGRQSIQRGDSISSTSSAPPHRILSRKENLESNPGIVNGVMWAITDMSTVPSGAVIIHPQTRQPLTNCDGSVYHYDPKKPLHPVLLPQISPDGIKVLNNPERRRSRLEKQRATHSPGIESEQNAQDFKTSPSVEHSTYEDCNDIEVDEYKQQESQKNIDSNKCAQKPQEIPNNSENESKIICENLNNNANSTDRNYDQSKESQNYPSSNAAQSAEYYEHNKLVNYDVLNEDNYMLSPYSETHGTNYYTPVVHPQYYTQGSIYDENNHELYQDPNQVVNYNPRPGEQLQSSTPTHHIGHPHVLYAAQQDPALGYTPTNEICYPAQPTQVLFQSSPFKLHEQNPTVPFLIPTAEQQQPVMVALSNKFPEHDVTQQTVPSYPIGYLPQMERPPVIASSPAMVNIASSHTGFGYQIPTAQNWTCWPQMAVYASAHHLTSTEDGQPKYSIPHGNYLSSETSVNTANMATTPTPYYPPANVLPTQPTHFYPQYPQSTTYLPSQYPMYQQIGQNSLLNQEIQTSNNATTNYFKSNDYQEDSYNKTRTNIKSPKSINSRGASNSGSSRTTPLTVNNITNNLPESNFANVDSTNFTPNYVVHPGMNYVSYHYPYHGIELLQANFENLQMTNQQKSTDNQNINKVGPKPVNKEANKNNSPKNVPNPSEINQKLTNTQQNPVKIYPTNNVDVKYNYKAKDRRRNFKSNSTEFSSSSSNQSYYNQDNRSILSYPVSESHNKSDNWYYKTHNPQEQDTKIFNKSTNSNTGLLQTPSHWRKPQGNQQSRESIFHNFPKNLNKQKYLLNNEGFLHGEKEKNLANYNTKEKTCMNYPNHQVKSQSSFESIQSPLQITPTSINAPAAPWLQPTQPNICNLQNNAVDTPILGNSRPSSGRPSRATESPASITTTSRSSLSRVNSLDMCLPTSQPRYIDPNLVGISLQSNAAYYQRTNLNTGLGLLQTPSIPAQSTFLFRKAPTWLRRPPAPGPALFGPAPPLPNQVRARAPRYHQNPRLQFH